MPENQKHVEDDLMRKCHFSFVSDGTQIIKGQQRRQKKHEEFDGPEAFGLPPSEAEMRMQSAHPQLLVSDGGGRVDDADEDESGNDEHEGGVELEDHSRRTHVIGRGEDALK